MTDRRVLANGLGGLGMGPTLSHSVCAWRRSLAFSTKSSVWRGVGRLCCLGGTGMHINHSVWWVAPTLPLSLAVQAFAGLQRRALHSSDSSICFSKNQHLWKWFVFTLPRHIWTQLLGTSSQLYFSKGLTNKGIWSLHRWGKGPRGSPKLETCFSWVIAYELAVIPNTGGP